MGCATKTIKCTLFIFNTLWAVSKYFFEIFIIINFIVRNNKKTTT